MEKYRLENDVKTFGMEVKEFPNGVAEAFHQLIKTLPGGETRSYYGIFKMDGGKMHYYAAAEQAHPREAQEFQLTPYNIEAGEYLTQPIHDWQNKIDQIREVFAELGRDTRVDHSKPGIEWYKNDRELLCMLKTVQSKQDSRRH